jgi:hypothetical protein
MLLMQMKDAMVKHLLVAADKYAMGKDEVDV